MHWTFKELLPSTLPSLSSSPVFEFILQTSYSGPFWGLCFSLTRTSVCNLHLCDASCSCRPVWQPSTVIINPCATLTGAHLHSRLSTAVTMSAAFYHLTGSGGRRRRAALRRKFNRVRFHGLSNTFASNSHQSPLLDFFQLCWGSNAFMLTILQQTYLAWIA